MKLIINNETLQKEIDSEYRAKSINIYEIEFEFSSEWDNLTKRVLFIKGDQVFEGAIINNRVMMPSIPNGVYAVGVVGFISENDIITTRKSTDLRCIEITESAAEYTANQDISDEQISMFERYLEMLTNKTNEALEDIEEAKQSALDVIDNAIDDFTEQTSTYVQRLGQAETDIDNLELEQTTQNQNISNLQTGLANTYNKTQIDEKITNINENITNLDENLTETIQNVSDLENDVQDLETNKASKNEIPDVSQFITKSVNDLVNYYKKNETYTQAEINQLISAIPKFAISVVQALPSTDISSTTIYLLVTGDESQNLYTEYIYVNNSWEKLGTQKLDLSDYYTIEDVNTLLNNYYTKTDIDTLIANFYTKPNTGIPKTDLASDVQTSLGKADTAIQEHQDISGKEDTANKVTTLSSSSTDTQYPSAKCVYDIVGDIGTALDSINGESI